MNDDATTVTPVEDMERAELFAELEALGADKPPANIGDDKLRERVTEARVSAEVIEGGDAVPDMGDTRRERYNRGSSRRLMRALEGWQKSTTEFIEELDRQLYAVNAEGERIGPAPLVQSLKVGRDDIGAQITALITQNNPADEEDSE